jgi:hypothetical protein
MIKNIWVIIECTKYIIICFKKSQNKIGGNEVVMRERKREWKREWEWERKLEMSSGVSLRKRCSDN